MTDIKLAIINAPKKVFPNIISLSLFHLCQSFYRTVEAEGLQQRYRDPNDRSIQEAAHSMFALAFVPEERVPEIFDMCYNEI